MNAPAATPSDPPDLVVQVDPRDWVAEVGAARGRGFGWFDSLSATDEVGRPDENGREQLRVMVRLEAGDGSGLRLECRVPRDEPVLDSLTQLFAGATWHEREVHDFFGVRFAGGDDRELLWHPVPGAPAWWPLRKDSVLAARSAQEWPGQSGEGRGPRRTVPLGVPDPQVWGDRDPDHPAPSAAELAAEVGGAQRTRRVPKSSS